MDGDEAASTLESGLEVAAIRTGDVAGFLGMEDQEVGLPELGLGRKFVSTGRTGAAFVEKRQEFLRTGPGEHRAVDLFIQLDGINSGMTADGVKQGVIRRGIVEIADRRQFKNLTGMTAGDYRRERKGVDLEATGMRARSNQWVGGK